MNKAAEGPWTAGSEGRVIAEKSGVVIGQCLWQEDAQLIVDLRNDQHVAKLEGSLARVEAALKSASAPMPPNATAADYAKAIETMGAQLRAARRAVEETTAEAEAQRRGWVDEIALRRGDQDKASRLETDLTQARRQIVDLEEKATAPAREQATAERREKRK